MEDGRIKRVTDVMKGAGLDQIIVTSTTSLYYLTGLWVEPFERMSALLVKADGSVHYYGNEIFGVVPAAELPVTTHKDGDDPTAQLSAALEPGAVGIDKFWYSKFLIGLMGHRPDVTPVEGSFAVDECRRVKDEAEKKAMRRSSKINDQVVAAAILALHDGVKENEMTALVNREFLARGADCEGTQMACFGVNGADPHHMADSSMLQPGDSVTFDIFTPISRYWCDMTRTVFWKKVSDRQREVYELVRRANEAAEAAVKPGVRLSELDGIARGIITEGGYGPYFTHRLGHGCGIDCHEPPDVSGASEAVCEPGMVFSIEPGIYLPGEFGVRIEDLVLVTQDGCEVLNQYPKDLMVVG